MHHRYCSHRHEVQIVSGQVDTKKSLGGMLHGIGQHVPNAACLVFRVRLKQLNLDTFPHGRLQIRWLTHIQLRYLQL